MLKISDDNFISNGKKRNNNLKIEGNGDYFETNSNSVYINDEQLIENLSTSFDQYLEENYNKRHGKSKSYHELETRQKRTKLNILTSQIICECIPDNYDFNSYQIKNKDIRAKVIYIFLDIRI